MANAINRKFSDFKANWIVWIFPIIAVAITFWIFLEFYNQRGPMVTISFEDASGIQPDKTRIRHKGVTVGIVKKVTISSDNKEVIAHVSLQKDAEHFAVSGSKFWLVLPKVNFQGVSGLETLFEGTYIATLPGDPEGDVKYDFKGQIGNETATQSVDDTTVYYLETGNADSLNIGDTVTFRGLKIGTVNKITLSKTAQAVMLQINIENKYVRLIRTNSVFWKKSAVRAKLGLFNSEIKVNSMDSILQGGIDVFTPDNVGERAKYGAKFSLLGDPPKGYEKWSPKLD